MQRHQKRLVIVLGVALSLGALIAFVGGPAGWNPDVTMGLALVLVVALSGWAAQNRGRPVPRTRRHEKPRDAHA